MNDHKPSEFKDQRGDTRFPELSAKELGERVETRRERFLIAAQRAKNIHKESLEAKQRKRLWLRPLTVIGAAAAVAMIVLGSFWMAINRPGSMPLLINVAEAGDFRGVNAVIISSFDRHCVGNVYAYEVSGGSSSNRQETFVARSDSSGILIIPPDEGDTERHYVLRHNEQEVGKLVTGSDNLHVSGFHQ